MHRCLTHVVRRFIPTHVGNTPHLRGGRTGRAFLAVLSLIDKTPGAKPEWKFKKAGHGQSIHAPARGATWDNTGLMVGHSFNPRPCARGDPPNTNNGMIVR